MRQVIGMGLLLLLASCASTAPSAQRDCIDPDRTITRFQVEASRTVVIQQSSYHRYRVQLTEDCPELRDAQYLGVSTGMPELVGYSHHGPVWAESRQMTGMCAKRGDYVIVPDPQGWFDRPSPRCKIASVQAL